MRLTLFTDYGLRTLMRLAGEPDRVFTAEGLANELDISRNHLTKVVRELAALGFVATRRGSGGGFQLGRSATAITLGDVARALEPRQALVECFQPDGGACTLTARCQLKRPLAAAQEAFFQTLDVVSLADCALGPPD
ncbi:Rrf2 family transcriptional regulator [Roseospira marina]|uniref:Rrf2 family transcriptional regulator n=1 Tax=Roseospira marina TaxID=140057 RepID=A0A5M6ICX2_9PROT|nr:Rrf2 family transcriptional regulator [Roseospira marina]KAA5606121.1 Rrf2 family transcriptional regulator [Roseospira marina]MBB4314259.1 Rrf2 family nitric oxide-sensitive transcriptional repressor [Roseospira marina]MBB5087419.1 Rrf2 family nitric oxide-sensitive transcriptional repressor [Roseospira marina]